MKEAKLITKEIKIGEQTITLTHGNLAKQADGAVMVQCGNTSILCTVTSSKEDSNDVDFFPLTVNYVEKYYAGGKIPSGFFKRESKQSEREILISRLIDRPLRPMFVDGYFRSTHVFCMLMSYDNKTEPDVVAMIGASAAVAVAGLPVGGVMAGCRVGYIDGNYIVNPNNAEMKQSKLDLVVAGTKDAILMVESEASELSEDEMLSAVMFGFKHIQEIASQIEAFAKSVGAKKVDFTPRDRSKLYDKMHSLYAIKVANAYTILDKIERKNTLTSLHKEIDTFFANAEENVGLVSHCGELQTINSVDIKLTFEKLQENIVRQQLIKTKTRTDGRSLDDVRHISTQVDCLPVVHGCGLFTRGNTQVMSIATLGSAMDEQMADSFTDQNQSQNFFLHYNFHSFSCGESTPPRAPGRREIGHGRLAYRALKPVLPTKTDFPYTIRLVAEVLESDGSTSMATVCSGALALMAAGVPIKNPIAGAAMGLIKEDGEYIILTDIMADEDHLGDMDFKVAGTRSGITALQMDIKIQGITEEILKHALAKAKVARSFILDKMDITLSSSRESINSNAPQIYSLPIQEFQISDIIGKGGANIKNICEKSGAKIDIVQNKVNIFANNIEAMQIAKKMIAESIGEDVVDIEYGAILNATVKAIMPFGVLVETDNGNSGLVHVSEIANHRVENIDDFVKESDIVKVKFIGKDNKGRAKFSIRSVDQSTGEDLELSNPPVIPNEIKKEYNKHSNERSRHNKSSREYYGDRRSSYKEGKKSERFNKAKSDNKPKQPEKKRKKFFFF